MLLKGLSFYQYVINISLHDPSQLVFKYFIHHPLVSGPSILKPEEHRFVTKHSLFSYKSYFPSSSRCMEILWYPELVSNELRYQNLRWSQPIDQYWGEVNYILGKHYLDLWSLYTSVACHCFSWPLSHLLANQGTLLS